MGNISEIKVATGSIAVVSESMIEPNTKVELNTGGFLIIVEKGQSMNGIAEILKEHNRAKLERDRLMSARRDRLQ